MDNINSKGLAEQIADYISKKIVKYELKPGQRIYEAKISRKFNISRSPVREALRILERKQLVEIIPRKGARVTKIDSIYISSLFDILSYLYSLASKKTVENSGYEDFEIAKEALKKIEKSAKNNDAEEYFEDIFNYVSLGLRYTGNSVLEKMLNDFLEINKRIQFLVFKENMEPLEENIKYFRDLTDAFLKNEADKAGDIIEAYVQNEKRKALKIAGKFNSAGEE